MRPASEFSSVMQWAFSMVAFPTQPEHLREQVVSYSSLNPYAKLTAQNINI